MRLRLKDFRQDHKLFQSDLASILQTTQSSISRMEMRSDAYLSLKQIGLLYAKYPKDDVDSYVVEEKDGISVSNNQNLGDGTQNNGVFGADILSLEIIKQQSDSLSKLMDKYVEQTDRIIRLIEKLAEKL